MSIPYIGRLLPPFGLEPSPKLLTPQVLMSCNLQLPARETIWVKLRMPILDSGTSVSRCATFAMSENVQATGQSSQPFQPFRAIEGAQAEIHNRSDN
jgi:hypothetical protein